LNSSLELLLSHCNKSWAKREYPQPGREKWFNEQAIALNYIKKEKKPHIQSKNPRPNIFKRYCLEEMHKQ
jgi:hypothetical protein